MESTKLDKIRQQIIITDKEDMVARTWLKGHPSLGESDQVVWIYEGVRDEFYSKIYAKKNVKNIFRIPRKFH